MRFGTTVVMLVVALLVVSGCSSDVEQPIKIGVSLPFTGPAATPGNYVKQGFEIAVSHLPIDEQKRVKFVYEDDRCDPTTGLTAAKKLAELDGVHFTMGPICGAVINPTLQYYDDQHVLRMHSGLGLDSYMDHGTYRFTLLGRLESLMKKLAAHAYNTGDHSVAILHLDDDYGRESAKYFAQYFIEAGGKIVTTESFPRGELDYRTQMLKIKESKPDGVFLASYGPQLVSALRQLNESAVHGQVYGIYNTEDPETIRSAGALSEGMIYPYFAVEDSPAKTRFQEEYKTRFNITNEMLSANAYDSFNLMWDAIKLCEEDVDCVRGKILATKDYLGASGRITVDTQGVADKALVIKRVTKGHFEVIP